VVLFVGWVSRKDEEERKKTISESMENFEMRMGEETSIYNRAERQAMINAFANSKYAMRINVNNKSETFNCELKVTDIKKITDIKWEVKLDGNDELGKSSLEGLLIFKGEGVTVKLSKLYSNRKFARQLGEFTVLLYEGAGIPEQLTGRWSFCKFEVDPKYSGTWRMAPA
jgi:hypothetical protein